MGIGSIIAGTDLGSANISVINNIDLISVGGSILEGVHISNLNKGVDTPFKKLTELDVTGNVEAGATIRVKKLIKQHVRRRGQRQYYCWLAFPGLSTPIDASTSQSLSRASPSLAVWAKRMRTAA